MRAKLLSGVALLLVLSGVPVLAKKAPEVAIPGNSLLTGKVLREVLESLEDQGVPIGPGRRCYMVKVLDSSVVHSSERTSLSKRGVLQAGNITETWTLEGCGAEVRRTLVVMPDGKGHSFVAIGDASMSVASLCPHLFKDEKHLQAWNICSEAAGLNDADAQYLVGSLLEFGKGIKKSYPMAAASYRRAADQGHAAAQDALGTLYLDGDGVEQDVDRAEELFLASAASGNVDAQYSLGDLYSDGYGRQPDFAEAMKWYEKAAGSGHIIARLTLGLMYISGINVEQDLVSGYAWLKMVDRVSTGFDELLDAVREDLTEEQLAAADKLYAELIERDESGQ